jgi:sirohydrochlorin ferrochelatase
MPESLIAVAHGSKDPRAAACVDELMSLVRSRYLGSEVQVRTAYLGHAAPLLPQVLSSVGPGRRVTVLPLLLTAAYHSKVDIPRMLARSPHRVTYASPLGPHPLLRRALTRRLHEADVRDHARTSVVLAAAGSSDPEANAAIGQLATRWQAEAGWRSVTPAYASAAGPTVTEAVDALRRGGARQVAVATYLLAPGFFADRIRHEAITAGAVAVSAALGAAPEVAEVIADRFLAATAENQAAA